MSFEGWYVVLGALMLGVALLDRVVRRLPITTTIVYLGCGVVLGPLCLGLMQIDPLRETHLLERITEVAVIVSLFTAGLKLRTPLRDKRWHLPVSLAFLAMALTVLGIALVGYFIFRLPLGAAILLGAVLAPTDPVLASDVQMEHPGDRDRLRFSLTGEAGLNDGTAFPFVLLGLALLEHDNFFGSWTLRWVAVDVLWKVGGGLLIGAFLGTVVGKFVVELRRKHEETVGRDEMIALGLICASYGLALLAHAYGFLAVFAAGLALRHIELRTATGPDREEVTNTRGEHIPGTLVSAVLDANEQLERLMEIGLVLLLCAMLSREYLSAEGALLAGILFFLIRPCSVWLSTFRLQVTGLQRTLLGWFGIRGIGSLYYLMHAVTQGMPKNLGPDLIGMTLTVVLISILVHGVSVTPIMAAYERRKPRKAEEESREN